MSERSGIPVSTLSKVEHDRLTLTYDKLQQLSQRLGIRMSDLFAEIGEPQEPPVTARRSIGRLDRAIQVTTPNYDYHYLCPELRRKRMIPVVTNIRAKTVEEFGDLVRHSGEEYIYVLEGRIEVHTEFYDPVAAGAGANRSTSIRRWATPISSPKAARKRPCSASARAPTKGLMSSLMNLHGSEGGEIEPAVAGVRDLRQGPESSGDRERRQRTGS